MLVPMPTTRRQASSYSLAAAGRSLRVSAASASASFWRSVIRSASRWMACLMAASVAGVFYAKPMTLVPHRTRRPSDREAAFVMSSLQLLNELPVRLGRSPTHAAGVRFLFCSGCIVGTITPARHNSGAYRELANKGLGVFLLFEFAENTTSFWLMATTLYVSSPILIAGMAGPPAPTR